MTSFFSAVYEYLWPATAEPAAEESLERNSAQATLRDKWTVSLSPKGKEAHLGKLIQGINPQYRFPIDSSYIPPNTSSDLFRQVGWDQGVVMSAKDGRPFTTMLGPCIVIQMRGKNRSEAVTHLGLVHAMSQTDGLAVFQETLEKMMAETEGEIELFIGGGYVRSAKLYQSIRRHIENVQVKNKQVTLKDDCFSVVDLATLFFHKGTTVYQGSAGIDEAGFDKDNQPFLVPSVQFTGYEGKIAGGTIGSIKSDYILKV